MRISTNVMALNAWRNLNQTTSAISRNLERLSSGLRINRAADDAAGLTISELMRSQIVGLSQAVRNAQDGISMVQTAEGALNQVHAILQRLRELAVQAANDTLTDPNRAEIQKEVRQLVDQVNHIGNTTHFNTIKLLNGQLNVQPATAAEIAGAPVTAPIIISASPTSGYAQGGPIPDTGYTGSAPKDLPTYLVGSADISQTDVLNVQANGNELTLNVDGTTTTIVLSVTNHSSVASLLSDINSKLVAGNIPVTASVDASNRLVLTHDTAGSGHTVQVTGGNAVDSLFGGLDGIVYTAGVDKGDVWIHDETSGFTAGSVPITDRSLATSPLTIGTSNNTLQFHYTDDGINWTEKTITLTAKTYNGTTGQTRDDLKTDIQNQIDAVAGLGTIRVDFDADHTLKLTYTGGSGSRIEVTGGTAMGDLFGAQSSHLRYTGQPANNVLSFDLDGTPQSVTLTSGYYDDADAVVAELNARFANAGIEATASNQGGSVRITSNSTGASSSVTNLGGSAAAELNLASPTTVSGTDGNHVLSITVDGETVSATLPEGTYNDLNALAAIIQNSINAATTTAADVTVQYDGGFIITSGSSGTSSRLTVNTAPSNDAAATLGLTGLDDQGTDAIGGQLTYQIGANSGESLTISIADMRALALGLSSEDSGAAGYDPSNPISNGSRTEYVLSLTTRDDAQAAIERIDSAILKVSDERANLGAVQNRLEHNIANLLIASENLTAAESRIRDADMAREMMEFVRQQILMQSGTAMLAQANLIPQSVLQLLG